MVIIAPPICTSKSLTHHLIDRTLTSKWISLQFMAIISLCEVNYNFINWSFAFSKVWLPTWITVIHGLPKVLLNRLQLVQNRAARIVTFTEKYEHITPSLIDLHWLPVEYRIIYKILLLVYKAINGLSPSYISNLLSFCSSSYSLRSCSNKLLQVLRSKLKSYGDRRFSIAGPKLWNSIPASLRNADSLNSFKKHLKTY